MARKKKKPDYDPEKSMEDLVGMATYGSYDDRVDGSYLEGHGSVNGSMNRHCRRSRISLGWWDAIQLFEGYRFETMRGLPFTYEIKRMKSGEPVSKIVFSGIAKQSPG